MKVYLLGRRTLAVAIISAAISFLLIFFKNHNIPISEQTIWKVYYEVQKLLGKYFPNDTELKREIQEQLNRRLIENEQLREYKVHRDVDYALLDYERREQENYIPNMKNQNILEEIDKLKYTDLQRKIVKDAVYYEFADGTMGIRGAWVAPDSREMHLE
tara:strand:- start:83 stop:559 length:477 start_codon:yes stop_codon:yes gene_type:complete